MKKITRKQVLNIIKRLCVVVFVVAMLFILPMVGLKNDDDMSLIYGTFLGSKSKYQGIIEVWNIDTFESGSNSKTSFLNSTAKSFQSKNKGLYIMVRNLTEFECANLLAKGEKPDLFSCSYVVANSLKDYLQPFSNSTKFDTASNFLEAGKMAGKQYAAAWCRGNYCLISTKAKIEAAEKAGAYLSLVESSSETETKSIADKIFLGEIKLSDIALTSGYKITSKHSNKIIYSIGLGKDKYLLPQIAFESYTNKGLVSISNECLDASKLEQSQYSAYSNFIAGQNVVLLGSQRDIFRMANRESLGKISDVIYEPLTKFTDLVQFVMLAKNDNNLRQEYAENFAAFLCSKVSQQNISSIGMFATCATEELTYNSGIMKDIASQNISDYKLNYLFS